jgi:hypothetical protein
MVRYKKAKDILAVADPIDIAYYWQLMALYLLIYASAEGAFILMALKEYLQDLAGVSDLNLLRDTGHKGVATSNKAMNL